MITCDYYGSAFLRENVTPQAVAENKEQLATSNILTIAPNPFRDYTDVRYQLTDNSKNIELRIYDATGMLVKSFRPTHHALRNTLSWDGQDDHHRILGSGVYFVTLTTSESIQTHKVLIAR
ncbi:MAG: T9SS type A sorting domain-containing protein [bacterium]